MKKHTTCQRIVQLRQKSQRILKESLSDQNLRPNISQTATHSSFATETESGAKSSGVTPTALVRHNLNLQIPVTSISPSQRQVVASVMIHSASKAYLSPTHKRITPQPRTQDMTQLLKTRTKELTLVIAEKERLKQELAVQAEISRKLVKENELLKSRVKSRPQSPRVLQKSKSLKLAMSQFRNKLEVFLTKKML